LIYAIKDWFLSAKYPLLEIIKPLSGQRAEPHLLQYSLTENIIPFGEFDNCYLEIAGNVLRSNSSAMCYSSKKHRLTIGSTSRLISLYLQSLAPVHIKKIQICLLLDLAVDAL